MQSIIALLLLAATPDASCAPTETESPAAKPAKAKKICRAGADTGTRMTSKICKTQAEWDAQLGADSTRLDRQRGGD